MSNVVPFPIRPKDIEPVPSPPVFMGTARNDQRLVFTSPFLRVYEEPPRHRMISLQGFWISLNLPWVVYAVVLTPNGKVDDLYVFLRPEPLRDEDDRLFRSYLPNVGKDSARVCFGNLKGDVKKGDIDPITAFWLSDFVQEDEFSAWHGERNWETYSRIIRQNGYLLPNDDERVQRVQYGTVKDLSRKVVMYDVKVLILTGIFSMFAFNFFGLFVDIFFHISIRSWLVGMIALTATILCNGFGRRLLSGLFRGFKLKKVIDP